MRSIKNTKVHLREIGDAIRELAFKFLRMSKNVLDRKVEAMVLWHIWKNWAWESMFGVAGA